MTHLNLARPKAGRPGFPDSATGIRRRAVDRRGDPTEMEEFDPDETLPMPRTALRFEVPDAEGMWPSLRMTAVGSRAFFSRLAHVCRPRRRTT